MLLAIDTCGPLGTVALAGPDGDLLGQTEIPGKTYSARLVPAIRELLAAANASIADIVTIVVTNGPGSFTGVRIGLSAAKGLAEAGTIPILAVSRLAVLAHLAQTRAAALDASRHEFYFGDYPTCERSAALKGHGFSRADTAAEEQGASAPEGIGVFSAVPNRFEKLLSRDEFAGQASALGAQLAVCEASVHAIAPSATLVAAPSAFDAIRFALPRLRACDFDDPVTLDGNYLRRSDAEIFAKPKLVP